jgi:hypothetical protein
MGSAQAANPPLATTPRRAISMIFFNDMPPRRSGAVAVVHKFL